MKTEDLQAYHNIISSTYDLRSGSYDERMWHKKVALRLVEELPVEEGNHVLDVATGTGTIAFHTADLVGSSGKAIGVDLSEKMIARANEKIPASQLNNIEFVVADIENLDYTANSFDRIYCASAFFWILNPAATLKHWHDLLKSGGSLGFHALPNTSYIWVSVAQRVLDNYDVPYTLNRSTGSVEKTHQLLTEAGYKNIVIRKEELGQFITLDYAKSMWIKKGSFAPGQHPHPLNDTPADIISKARRDYDAVMEKLNTDKGIWNDLTMYYIYAEK